MNNARPPPELSPDNQRICQQLVEREVGHCLSGLIQHFLKHPDSLAGSVYDWEEDIFTLCSQDDWEATWEDYLSNNADDENKHSQVEDYELACRHVGIEEPFRKEAYEHWIVSDWFATQLTSSGEIVGELFGLKIWGRCTTGQAISLDAVVLSIAKQMEILTGQTFEWRN